MDNENPILLSETKGLDNQLQENLCGSNGREWLEAYKTFMKKQPTWISTLEIKNKLLRKIHQDETGIVYKMCGADACFEELFGSLCGHTKQKKVNGIPALMEKLKENNLLFPSKETGVNYIKSGVKSGIHKKGFTYFFAYLDEDGNIFVADVYFDSGELEVRVYRLSYVNVWFASYARRIVIPATKLFETKS